MSTETKYPEALDDDISLPQVDDNLTEIGGEAINAIRDAVFAIEDELGINPSGSKEDVAERLDVSLNPDGTIKALALESVGLATLPIVNSHVAINAGIEEQKLNLYYGTDDLNTKISVTSVLTESVDQLAKKNYSDLLSHIGGALEISDGYSGRHVASQIDLNTITTDIRDINYSWTGLKDKNNNLRSGTEVATALLEINNDLINHENALVEAHPASSIIVDSSEFVELSEESDTVQKVINELDQSERIGIGRHRATEHTNGIPLIARSYPAQNSSGEGELIIPTTAVKTFLIKYPNISPVDDQNFGDDIVQFLPSNFDYKFDAQFSNVRSGDIITINYNNIAAQYLIDSIRFLPGTEWIVRLNGVNLFDLDGYDGYASASISRPLYDRQTAGVLALAPANAIPNSLFSTFLSSLIIGSPRGASVVGRGFNPHQLDSNHYKLYLQIYPTGNPEDHVINLPPIDITGNAGVTSGSYTLSSILQSTNNAFRNIGYNYRFIAFEYKGEFGLMLADSIGNASFSIVSGDVSSGILTSGSYTKNILGGDTLDSYDALGFGNNSANLASPAYFSTYLNSTHAQLATKIFLPFRNRFAIVNGQRVDKFNQTYGSVGDGYWPAIISARTPIGGTTVEVTYLIEQNLSPAELKPGKTIVVQPTVSFDDSLYQDVDYGRFIIKEVSFDDQCGLQPAQTQITVINGIHATGNGFDSSSEPQLPVKIYFSEDSVSCNLQNVIDSSSIITNYARFHEVYFTEEGNTFTHERARLPLQIEDFSPQFLGTSRFRITNVSSKLRGYSDNSSDFHSFVRLYILTYDSISGEFDGYLGQRDPGSPAILRPGPITKGRKNLPVKFYDETGNDFIELEFRESFSPGTSILSTEQSRFVDIELFNSLQLNDELFYLGSCEVNWDPQANQDIIEKVINRRNFGSVSEDDLTSSALQYLSVPEKYLHENGVLFGFDFVSVDTLDNRQISFLGGKAIVDGKIIIANHSIVNIPFLYPNGESLPQVVKWVICLNSFGQLIPHVLTATKSQYFATNDGINNYYLDSVTLYELLNERKDLCPIYTVNANISSVIISEDDISDLRRYVYQESASQILTWSTENSSANFRSLDSLKNWVNNFHSETNIVHVQGNFEFNEAVDCHDFDYPIHFLGNGTKFTLNNKKGILLGSNLTFENFTFEYNPVGASYSLNHVSMIDLVNSENGCLFYNHDYDLEPSGTSINVENIFILNCKFYHNLNNQSRPPFISILLNGFASEICRNIKIKDCQFFDTDDSSNMAAVAIINSNINVANTYGCLLHNCEISNLYCDKNQGIYLSSLPGIGGVVSNFGLSTVNTEIKNNQCGVIGYCVSGYYNLNFVNPNQFSSGLTINNNTCHYIATLDGTGTHTFIANGDPGHHTSHVIISENFCNWIHASFYEPTTINQTVNLTIKNNNLQAYDFNILYKLYLANLLVDTNSGNESLNAAILVYTKKTGLIGSNCEILNNTIVRGNFGPGNTYRYSSGLFVNVPALISGNIIRGLASNGKGIFIDVLNEDQIHLIITNNFIYRDNVNLHSYIHNRSTITTALISNNFFNSETINGSSTDLINNSSMHWIYKDNKNQTQEIIVPVNYGVFLLNGQMNSVGFNSYFIRTTTGGSDEVLRFHYEDVGNTITAIWGLALTGIIPHGAKIISVSCEAEINENTATTKTFAIELFNNEIGLVISASGTLALSPGNTITLNPFLSLFGNDAFYVKYNNDCNLILKMVLSDPAATYVNIKSIRITYRF